MWEQRYNLLDAKIDSVENRHEDERLNLAGRLETLSGHLRNALGQVQNDNETQQTWNVETRDRLRCVESALEGVKEQVSDTSRDDIPLPGTSDVSRDALRDLNRKIQNVGTNLYKVNQKADNIRGDLNHQVNDTQQAITGFRNEMAAVNTIATDLQSAMNELNTIRNSVNDLTVEQATLRRLDTDMTAVKRGVQDNTRQLDRHVNDLRLSVNTLRDQFNTTHDSCHLARTLQDRVSTLNNEFRTFLRTLEGQGILPPGTSNDYTEPCMADTNVMAPDASTPNRHGLLRTRAMPPTPGLLGMSTGVQPQSNSAVQGGATAAPPTGMHPDMGHDINDLRSNQTFDDLRMCNGGIDTVAPPPTANAANGVNKKLFEECVKAIKIYDGADSSQFRPWIRSIEKATNCGIYNPHKVAHMKSIGALEKVVRQNMHRTWGDLKQVLQHRFSDLRTDQDTVRALASCRQGSGSVAAYIDEFTELVAGATSTASYIQQFIDGLSNRLVRNALVVTWRKGSTTTLHDIMDMASEKDKIYGDMEDVDLVGQLLTTNNMASVQRGASLNEVIAREVSNHFLRNKEYDPSNRARDPGGEGDSSPPPRDGRRGRFGKWLPRHLFLAKMREMLNQKVKERDEGETPKDPGHSQTYNKKVAPGYHTAVGPHVDANLAEVSEPELSASDVEYFNQLMEADMQELVQEVSCNMVGIQPLTGLDCRQGEPVGPLADSSTRALTNVPEHSLLDLKVAPSPPILSSSSVSLEETTAAALNEVGLVGQSEDTVSIDPIPTTIPTSVPLAVPDNPVPLVETTAAAVSKVGLVGEPEVMVNIGLTPFTALLDTGCSDSMIRTDVAGLIDPKCVLECSDTRYRVSMAGEQFSSMTQGKIMLHIKVREQDYRHWFILYDHLRFPIFLGRDFLSQNHLTISWSGEGMTLSDSLGVIAVNEVDVQEFDLPQLGSCPPPSTNMWTLGTLVAPFEIAVPPGVTTAVELDLILEEGLQKGCYEMDVVGDFNCKGINAKIYTREFKQYPPFEGVPMRVVCEFQSEATRRLMLKEGAIAGTVQFRVPGECPARSYPKGPSEEDIFNDDDQLRELESAFPEWYNDYEPSRSGNDKGARVEVTGDQQDRLQKLIRSFPTLFSAGEKGVKQTDYSLYTIDTVGNPIDKKPYPLPISKRAWVEDEIERLHKAGIIRHSVSPWCSPIIVVDKKQIPGAPKEYRLVVDYRALNGVTILKRFQLPLIPEILHSLKANKYISVLDVCRAYYSIRIAEKDKCKTAFQCPGLPKFEFNYVSFGLVNAPYAFQQLITSVLFNAKVGRRKIDCHVYLDDMIILSQTFDEHLEDVGEVLARMQAANLTLKENKYHFLKDEVNFLGYTICHRGVKPQIDKVQAIIQLARPVSKGQLRSFIGAVGVFRPFLPYLSHDIGALNGLLKKGVSVKDDWTEECQTAFDRTKSSLADMCMTIYPNPDLEYRVYVDASKEAIGAMLAQPYLIDGKDYDLPVAFMSHTFTKIEQKYATIVKEALGILYCFKKWFTLLEGSKVVLMSDAKALMVFLRGRTNNNILDRISLMISRYTPEIMWVKGSDQRMADMISPNADSHRYS